MNQSIQTAIRTFRRAVVGIVGGTVVLLGLALLVLPGPAFVVLPVGLAILGIEFAWARRWLRRLRAQVRAVAGTSSQAERVDPAQRGERSSADGR